MDEHELILRRAVERWGEKQEDMAVEELCEMVVALLHHRRGRVGLPALASEIADARIMLRQMEMRFGIGAAVEREIAAKVARLSRRLDAEPI